MKSSAKEVVTLIKLGGDINIDEYGIKLTKLIPYFKTTAKSITDNLMAHILEEDVNFRTRDMNIRRGSVMKIEFKRKK